LPLREPPGDRHEPPAHRGRVQRTRPVSTSRREIVSPRAALRAWDASPGAAFVFVSLALSTSKGVLSRSNGLTKRKLQSAVARVGAHVLPVPAMTTDEMTRPAHLTTFGPVGRSGVVVRFGSAEPPLTATAVARLRDPQPRAVGRVLRTRPRIMAGTTAGAASPRRSIESANGVRNSTNHSRRQEERAPIDSLLNRRWRWRRPTLRCALRKEYVGLQVCHGPFYQRHISAGERSK
jgi:hypothetical protein